MQKKIVLALVCATQMTCFGMNTHTVHLAYPGARGSSESYSYLVKEAIEAQKQQAKALLRQAEAQERQAVAQEHMADQFELLIAYQDKMVRLLEKYLEIKKAKL